MVIRNMSLISNDQIAAALETFRNQDALKDNLLSNAQQFILTFHLFKIPNVPAGHHKVKEIRIVMPHLPEERNACLFVGDGENAEDRTKIDDTIHMYEELFRAQNITSVKEVIPLLKLKLEYQTFESRKALASRYDAWLADDKICRFLPHLLGKAFYHNKRRHVQLNVSPAGLAERVSRAVSTELCVVSFGGTTSSVTVGESEMTDTQIIENVQAAVAKIIDGVPGGQQNLASFNLCLHGSAPLPLYISTVDRASVPQPEMPAELSKATKNTEGNVSTIKGVVSIGPDGTVTITKPGGHVQIIGGKSMSAEKSKVGRPVSKNRVKGAKRRKPNSKGLRKASQENNAADKGVKRKSSDPQAASAPKQPKAAGRAKSKPAKDRRRHRGSPKSSRSVPISSTAQSVTPSANSLNQTPTAGKGKRKSALPAASVTPKLNVTSKEAKVSSRTPIPRSEKKVQQSKSEATPSRKPTVEKPISATKKTPNVINTSNVKSTPGKAKRQSMGTPKPAIHKSPMTTSVTSMPKHSAKSSKTAPSPKTPATVRTPVVRKSPKSIKKDMIKTSGWQET